MVHGPENEQHSRLSVLCVSVDGTVCGNKKTLGDAIYKYEHMLLNSAPASHGLLSLYFERGIQGSEVRINGGE